jgi:hypothetical protein
MRCCHCRKLYECFEDHKECVRVFDSPLTWFKDSRTYTEKYDKVNCFELPKVDEEKQPLLGKS